jgi:hypothetical protein
MKIQKVLFSLCLLLTASALYAHGWSWLPQYNYQTVDIDPASLRFVEGNVVSQGLNSINDNGVAVGAFQTDVGALSNFTFEDGRFRILSGTAGVVRGINKDGEMSGFATLLLPGTNVNVGFVTDSRLNAPVHILQAPNSNLTELIGLNDKLNQLSVGDARDIETGVFRGVVFRGGQFLKFVDAGVNGYVSVRSFGSRVRFSKTGKFQKFENGPLPNTSTALMGVNNRGEIVGFSTDALGTHAFHLLRDGSEGPSLDSILCGLPGLFGPAFPSDINNKGEIVGTYVKGDTLSGFIVMNGVAFEISFPGAETTEVSGINAAGTIVGSYLVGGIRHGFMATRN